MTKERAVAIQYQDIEELPRIVAQGAGEAAREIVRLAEEHGVPVTQDEQLMQLLSKTRVGDPIPETSFRIVAEIVCFLHHLDTQYSKGPA